MFVSENLKTYQTKENSFDPFFNLCKISKDTQKIILEKNSTLYEFLQKDNYHGVNYIEEITPKKRKNIEVYIDSIIDLMNPFIKEKCSLNGVTKVKEYLKLKVGFEPIEYFGLITLDSKLDLIDDTILFNGTTDQCQVYIKEIIRKIITDNATSIIIYHNHPSGDSKQSRDDIRLTECIEKQIKIFGVSLSDHFILTKSRINSFRCNELLDRASIYDDDY